MIDGRFVDWLTGFLKYLRVRGNDKRRRCFLNCGLNKYYILFIFTQIY